MSQNNLFFEGQDFPGSPFKALMPEFYPPEYQKYIKEEAELIKEKVQGMGRVLEAGVGIGRLIPIIAPRVREMIGVDKAEFMVSGAQRISELYRNVSIRKGNLEKLTSLFPGKDFDVSICAWNTLGNVENEVEVLSQLRQVTKGPILVSVFLKGTLAARNNWYKTVGIELDHIDENTETVYTKTGLRSKAYNLPEISELAKNAGLKVKDSKILNQLVLWIELEA